MLKSKYGYLYAIIALFSPAINFSANAQKLPNIQKEGLRAPANVKIDGNTTEWNDQFQAYNHATDIFYTMANDGDNLYLVVQATNADIINKIITGGITLTINTTLKKSDDGSISVAFPLYEKNDGLHYIPFKNKPVPTNNAVNDKLRADSFMRAINKQLIGMCKMIQVIGVKAVADSVISIYNQQGIKAAALFDVKTNYNYELAVPLKYLGLDKRINKLAYNIRLNGGTANKGTIQLSGKGRFLIITSGSSRYAVPVSYQAQAYPTDFWGEYTLAK